MGEPEWDHAIHVTTLLPEQASLLALGQRIELVTATGTAVGVSMLHSTAVKRVAQVALSGL